MKYETIESLIKKINRDFEKRHIHNGWHPVWIACDNGDGDCLAEYDSATNYLTMHLAAIMAAADKPSEHLQSLLEEFARIQKSDATLLEARIVMTIMWILTREQYPIRLRQSHRCLLSNLDAEGVACFVRGAGE